MNKVEKNLLREQLLNYLTTYNLRDEIEDYCKEMGFDELSDFLNPSA